MVPLRGGKISLSTEQDLLYCRRIVFKISDEHPVHFKWEYPPGLPSVTRVRRQIFDWCRNSSGTGSFILHDHLFLKKVSENVICGRL